MNQSMLLTYHVRCSACWHTLLLHRGGVSACYSWFPLCARSRLPWSYTPRYIPSSSTKCSQSPQQPYATTVWRISFYAAPPTPQHIFPTSWHGFKERMVSRWEPSRSFTHSWDCLCRSWNPRQVTPRRRGAFSSMLLLQPRNSFPTSWHGLKVRMVSRWEPSRSFTHSWDCLCRSWNPRQVTPQPCGAIPSMLLLQPRSTSF